MVRDGDSGTTRELPVPTRRGPPAARGGGYAGLFAVPAPLEDASESFGSLSQISAVGIHPWRMNAKLAVRFRTTGGEEVWYSCSGSMIDAEVVLTASHCVYARDPNGDEIFDWAEEVWVYPGWDGGGATGLPESVETYGYGWGNWYRASTAWIEFGDTTYDLGLVRIERAVGMLTGWYGWAYGFSCAAVQSRTSHNASYPSEECGEPGLHTGRDMYYWSGVVDACPGNSFRLDTGGGCFGAMWGGMSGSSMYFVEHGDLYAEAVASTSDRSTVAFYARLWSVFVTDMNDTVIPDARGDVFDLQALYAVASPTAVTAGQQLDSASFLAANPTNGAADSSYPLGVYLSSDELLSTTDTLLQSTSFGHGFAPMSSATVDLSVPPTIPLGTPSGIHWLGIVLDASVDGNPSNNATSHWDAQAILVDGVADLVASDVDAPGGTFAWGEPLAVGFLIENRGGDPSTAVTVEIRASANQLITTYDPLLGSYQYGGVAGVGALSDVVTPRIPGGLAEGSYHIGLIAFAENDIDSWNDKAFDPTPIVVDGLFADGFESGGTSAWSDAEP
jgi:hypothetical protein